MLRLEAPPRCRFIARAGRGGRRWLLREGARGARALAVSESPFVIGRAADCNLILPDSAQLRRTTSRWHCHLVVNGGEVLVTDGSFAPVPESGGKKPSKSGTYRNGRRVRATETLLPGDTLRVGPWSFAVDAAPAPRVRWGTPGSEAEPWEDGKVISDIYEVRGLLGVGGMGAVYRVRHKTWDIDLAVKRPTPRLLEAAGGAERFAREAETWVNLPLHPHIVTAYYVRSVDGSPAIFAECVEGGDLRSRMQEGRPRDLASGLDAAIQVCWGMAVAHSKGLVHRDLKPANILMGLRGEAKVTDFGLVKRARERDATSAASGAAAPESSPSLTRLGATIGTPPYMPPEQWRSAPVGPAADVYSFGVMLYELLCGRLPFELPDALHDAMGALKLEEFRRMHLEDTPPDPLDWNSRIPAPLAGLMRRCLAKDPACRPRGFNALAEELTGFYRDVAGHDYDRQNPGALEGRAAELNNRALSMLDLGDAPEARKLLVKALKVDPHHPEAAYNHATLQWQAGEIDDMQAVKRLEEAAAAQPDSWTAAYLLGLVHLRRADARAAERALTGAWGRPGPEALLALGDARMAAGRHAEAEAAYSQARTAAPESLEAERRLVAALSAQGKRKEAASFWGGEDYPEAIQGLEFPDMRCLRELAGHKGYVQCLAACPDGRRAVSGGLDKTIRLWDLASGRCERVLGGLENTPFLAVTPDGRHALAQGVGGDIAFWDLESGDCAQRIEGHAKSVVCLALTPDGRHAASGDEGGTILFWDLTYASPMDASGVRELAGGGSARALAVSRDGRRVLAGGDDDGRIRVWDTVSGQLTARLRGHKKAVVSLAVAPDGERAVSASWDGTLRVWDLARGECVRALAGHSSATSVALSPDGRRLLSGGMDKTVRLWDLESGICLRTFEGHGGSVYAVAFTPDGRALSGGSDRVVRLWSVAPRLPPLPPAFAHLVSSEEAASLKQRAALLREAALSEVEAGEWGRADAALRQARAIPGYARDPALLALSDQVARKGVRKRLASHWLHRTLRGHASPAAAVAVSDDEHLALSGGADASVKLWALDSGALLCSFDGHPGPVNALAFLPGGGRALSAGEEGALLLWDIDGRRPLGALEGHLDRVNGVEATPDGRLAVSAGEDGSLRVWDIARRSCARVLTGHRGAVKAVAVAADGACAASAGDDGTVRLWELAGGRCLRVFKGHDYSVHCLAFSPDCRSLLSGSGDLSVRLWDAATGACRAVIDCSAPVSSLAFSPEGRHAFCALRGATSFSLLTLLGQGGEAHFDAHARPVTCAAAASSGRYAVSAGEDGLVLVWRLDWEYEFPPADAAAPEVETALKVFLEARGGRWSEEDWKALYRDLGSRGFGPVASEGVRERLEGLTRRFPRERRDWLRERYGS